MIRERISLDCITLQVSFQNVIMFSDAAVILLESPGEYFINILFMVISIDI